MIYNFALPPLILHTFLKGNSGKLSNWAATLKNPSRTATFFNFLDSHDGIGVMGTSGILDDDEIEFLAQKTIEYGGMVSYRSDKSGIKRIYELNITSYNALNRNDSGESTDIQVKRYIAARSIVLTLKGVPGIYLHGLFGSKNYIDGVRQDNDNRSINRYILTKNELLKSLLDKKNPAHMIMNILGRMIHKRTTEKAFHPHAGQEVLELGSTLFGLVRHSMDGREHVIIITNVTGEKQRCTIALTELNLNFDKWHDILSGKKTFAKKGLLSFMMKPYEVRWLKAEEKGV